MSISLAHIFFDSQSAVDGVMFDLEDYGPNDIYIRDIRGILHLSGSFSLHHIRRQANKAAHLLALHSLLLSSNIDWSCANCPIWFSNIVNLDCIS